MKRFITLLTLAFMLAFVSNSIAGIPVNKQSAKDYSKTMFNPRFDIPVSSPDDAKADKPFALASDTVFNLENSYWSHLLNGTPFVVDKNTGAYFVTAMDRIFDENSGSFLGTEVYALVSTDGSTWEQITVLAEDDMGGFYPSIEVASEAGASVNDVNYLVTSLAYIANGSEWVDMGIFTSYGTPSNSGTSDYYIGPDDVNDQTWQFLKLRNMEIEGDPFIVGAGMLSPESDNDQYGYYGFFGWDINEQEPYIQTSPDAWGLDKYKASEAKQSSYQNRIYMDYDNEGNVYAGVNNLFIEDVDVRVPGVSKSTDYGASWEAFNQMPSTILDDYIGSTGFDTGVMIAYEADAFVVTGVDQYSYILRMGFYNTGDNVYQEIHIVEAAYKNGSWSMHKVADLNGFPQIYSQSSDFSNGTNWVYFQDDDPLGNELQIVKTTDGSEILLKWIDNTSYVGLDTTLTITYDQYQADGSYIETEAQIDTVAFTDVFVAHREMDADSWSEPQNVTDDPRMNYKCVWLPNEVADLNEVPMIYHDTPDVTNTEHPAYVFPQEFLEVVGDLWPYVMFTTFSVEGVDVEEETSEQFNFSLYDARPNPANEYTELAFELTNADNVSIELYNSLGQLVSVLFEGYQTSGYHNIGAVDLSNYTAGAYYVKLTVGTKSLTKSLNIVK